MLSGFSKMELKKKSKSGQKTCFLLEEMGMSVDNISYKKQWIVDICVANCPLEDDCIYDKKGWIKKEDKEKLLKRLKELKEKTSSLK